MKNQEQWQAGKFVLTSAGRLAPSPDPRALSAGSRFIGSLQAPVYEEAIRTHASGILLDLACGNVPFYGLYKDLVEDNVCADWGGTLHKSPHLDHEFDLNKGIPLPDGSFDTVLVTDVLEHIAEPDFVWAEMARVLKPRGKIILTVPFLYWVHEAPYDFHRYTEFRLKMFCEKNDLTVASLEPYGGAAEVVIDVIAKQLADWALLSRIHLFLGRLFVHSPIGKKMTARSRRSFPLGYCLIARKP